MPPRHGGSPGAIPGSRTNFLTDCASARGRVPKTQLTPGSTEAVCRFHFRGRGRQVMHLPCKQVYAGALPADSTIFKLRETRPMHREKPHKLLQVGVTPTPAPIFQGSDPAARL